jgi:hypothetical protein
MCCGRWETWSTLVPVLSLLGIAMPHLSPFHSAANAARNHSQPFSVFYHDNSVCSVGRKISPHLISFGTGGYTHCSRCCDLKDLGK